MSEPDWMAEGLCRTSPLSPQQIGKIMFPEDARGVAIAKRICAQCPIKPQCREFAISTGQTHGIWGGMSQLEMKRERTKIRAAIASVPTSKVCEVSGLTVRQATYLAKNGYLRPTGGKGFAYKWPFSEIVIACLLQGVNLEGLVKRTEGLEIVLSLSDLVRQAPLTDPWLVVSPPKMAVGVPDAESLPDVLEQAGPVRFVVNLQEVKEKVEA